MKYLFIALAIFMALTGAGIVVFATLVGTHTGGWGWMIVSILWFGVSLLLASWMLNRTHRFEREESNR